MIGEMGGHRRYISWRELRRHHRWWWKLWVGIQPTVYIIGYVFIVVAIFAVAYMASFI